MGRTLRRGKSTRAANQVDASDPRDDTAAIMKKSTGAASLDGAIAGMQALKAEHAPILAQLARDAGMSPETRVLLVAHLLEEEDEKLATIAAAAKGRTTGAAGSSQGGSSGARLTIGSLRMTSSDAQPLGPNPASPTTRTVGSLRGR